MRVFSGIQPTGSLHLGNLLGAVRNWVDIQHESDAIFCVVDLHAITLPQDPATLREATVDLARLLVACGLDPEVCILFVQGHVPAHTELGWLMECTASFGELRRMVQFKDKSDKAEFTSAALFTYPALQAADILLYDTNQVPVGEDQRQHLELARDVALRFNHRYGDTFVVPEAVIPRAGARVMDLQNPSNKMSKSADSDSGTIYALDDLKAVERKIKRAVTDSDAEVRFDIAAKPGVSNLLSILAAVTGREPEAIADDYEQYGPLKKDTAEAVVEFLRPIQARHHELAGDRAATDEILRRGAEKASAIAVPVLDRARHAIGLLART
ncbi:MAG: tryptophan--tRNA ligase [Acidimicrobiia bacterium]|nr:tryptophan--tRNA ligase [Acidimicrobiia bacterium]